jgi:D-beta-D-heptose 7-phosphate kinase/D-beta-D-heptose 1-phosphate adenosyltransferase
LEQQETIAVLGDLITDEFFFGTVDRVNPEAPTPLMSVERREIRLGGAANVANNIISLGGRCLLIGKTGLGDPLPGLLDQVGIRHDLVFDSRFTPVRKTRFVAGNQQLIRVDEEAICPLTASESQGVLRAVAEVDTVVVADYGKGFVTRELMDGLRQQKKTILADPKTCSAELFHDVHVLKPNSDETKYALRMNVDNEDELVEAATRLQQRLNCHLLITRGKEGMSLFELGAEPMHIPTRAKEVFDVTGAGDTVMAALALALASGETLEESVILANHAAGIVVSKVGTATVTKRELASALESERRKVKTQVELVQILAELRHTGKTVVFTNGCFDILHIGHTRLLNHAKSCGDILVLGLNSDESIRRLKGPARPIVQEKERAEIMAALESVDYIVFFAEDDPCSIIAQLRPDVHVKGGDYNPGDFESMPEARIIQEYGGRIEIVELTAEKSTSDIIQSVRQVR